MSITVPLEGFGGGGGADNSLRIVGGTTRPANPSVNMIWANTPNEITSYVLSATEPETPVEGMLWLKIGDSGSIKIPSPVGKDWITVYPLSAEQYVSGVWNSVEVISYQDGVWVAYMPEGALYYQGNELTDITGGWGADDFGYTWAGFSDNINDIIKNSDSMTIKSISGLKVGLVGTKNKISFSGYSKLTMRYSANATHENAILYLCSARTATSNDDSVVAKIQYPSGDDKKISLDLTGVSSGSYYVLVAADGDVETTIYGLNREK